MGQKFLFILGHLYCSGLLAGSLSDLGKLDAFGLNESIYHRQCLEIKEYLVDGQYDVECNSAFHHYNSAAWKKYYRSGSTREVKIAGFNVFHPGNARTAFKDYSLVAQVINQYDVLSAMELLPVIGRDYLNNINVVDYILNKENSHRVRSLYRAPGYLKILDELRKLDPSWSLILTPKGEAAQKTNVHELLGFFYRSSKVRPIENEHCNQYYGEKSVESFACFPALSKEFMNNDLSEVFSRRPFMASFKVGKFDFTLVSSHVIFNSPDDPEEMKNILGPAFGIEHYEQLDEVGFTQRTYARFSETKIILELLKNLKSNYEEKDVIYVGDMNLNHDNPFWNKLLKNYDGTILLGNTPTSLSKKRFDRDGKETLGLASSYDHFLIDKNNSNSECANSKDKFQFGIKNFLMGSISDEINKKYIIRYKHLKTSSLVGHERYDYVMRPGGEEVVNELTHWYRESISNKFTIKRGEITKDDYRIDRRVQSFVRRVLFDQLKKSTYYKVYHELISDHLPIAISCRTNKRDDD